MPGSRVQGRFCAPSWHNPRQARVHIDERRQTGADPATGREAQSAIAVSDPPFRDNRATSAERSLAVRLSRPLGLRHTHQFFDFNNYNAIKKQAGHPCIALILYESTTSECAVIADDAATAAAKSRYPEAHHDGADILACGRRSPAKK